MEQGARAERRPVNHDDGVGNLEASGAERRGGLENGGAAGDEVLDDEADLAGAEGAFNRLGGTVVLDLLTAHEHRNIVLCGNTGGDGKGGVRNAADEVIGGGGGRDDSGERLRNLAEERRIRDDEAEVDVDGGKDAGFELELAELDGGDVVELEDQRLHSLCGN